MKIRLSVFCGMYVGNYKWQNTEDYEPDECGWSGYIDYDEEDYEDYGMPLDFRCPFCDAILEDDSHFEIIK
jgi:hypothetical protein